MEKEWKSSTRQAKKIILLSILFLFFCVPFKVNAATISVSSSSKQAVVGGNVNVTITIREPSGLGAWQFNVGYDSSKLQLTSGTLNVAEALQRSGEVSRSYHYSFRVKAPGDATVSIASSDFIAIDEVTKSAPKGSTTIHCVTQQEILDSYSKNNNLSSLSVDGYEITPAFSRDTLDYSLEVENDVTKINIVANKEDSKASISGTGEKEVHEGSNAFDIVVTAENGSSKTYHLTVTVKELNPIKEKIDGKEYTVVRKSDELKDMLPKYFEETKIKLGDEEVLAYENKTIKLTLVALKDKKGNISFYIYKNKKFVPYYELTSGNLAIHLIDDKSKIPTVYKKQKEKVNDKAYTVYKQNKKDAFFLVYGENVETGKKSLYLYDTVEKTLQRYNTDLLKVYQKDLQVQKYIIVGLTIFIVLLLIILILLLKTKRKRKPKKERKEF